MSHFDAQPLVPAPPPLPMSDRDAGAGTSAPGTHASQRLESAEFEAQLGEVIRSARDVAASAEELLRELALRQQILLTGRGRLPPLVVDQGLLFLDAMRHRLLAALDGLPLR